MKKFLLSALALVAVAALAITGTIAYLQWEDEDVNVMTLGNVKIDQFEMERNADGKLIDFNQGKPAYPAVYQDGVLKFEESGYQSWEDAGAPGSNELFDDSIKNVIDKFVFVKNIGTTDAYYRTYIAIECPNGVDWETDIHINVNGNERFKTEELGYYDHKDTRYYVVEMLYKEILTPNEVSRPSLLQVFLDPAVTNEQCALFKDEWEIIVFSQAVQAAGFEDAEQAVSTLAANSETVTIPAAKVALDAAFGEPVKAWVNSDYDSNVQAWMDGARVKVASRQPDAWDGTADTSWYNDTDAEFVIMTAEQLAGFAKLVDDGNTFEGKTVKLGKDIDLVNLLFNPIGSYRKELPFKGVFDGQDHVIKNLSQNTWELNTGYKYSDLGLGLFACVEDATIKDLVIDGASISGESALCGTVAATAYGDCIFENITVKNAQVADYQYYAGGIVGWASGNHTYKNIHMDASSTIGSQWGDFGNANGGIIGGCGSSAIILMEDCTVACRIDATNDIVSAYQWSNYRNSGMLIGRVPQTITSGEVQTVATPENVICKNVTVVYGDWANYTYCEFAGTGYPYVRVQAGTSVDAYTNIRYGHPTDANGNTVVDDNHVHNDGEAHYELIIFDQLFGGPADHRYCYYGISAFDGVNVIYNNK